MLHVKHPFSRISMFSSSLAIAHARFRPADFAAPERLTAKNGTSGALRAHECPAPTKSSRIPPTWAGLSGGGSRLHLATLLSGRAERSAGSPIRSFFRSRKTQRSSQSASRIRRAPFLRFSPKRSRWCAKTFSTKAALPNTPPSIR